MGSLGSLATAVSLLCVLLGPAAAGPQTVFLDRQQASSVISRHKRDNQGDEEKNLPPNLERECLEEVCQYEEAREVFKDSYRTDIFWSVYIDGDQCLEKPCLNGAMCSDSVGGYDCVCKSGFSGVHCDKDETACTLEADKGCAQFCKPGYVSYECSCARGWKADAKEREKCVPAVTFPCGKVSSLSMWESRKSENIASNMEGLRCGSMECPWQALLKSDESAGFCSGVILKDNLVLTSYQCTKKYRSFSVAVGKRTVGVANDGEQNLLVKIIHEHPRYLEGSPENDLAVLQLKSRIVFRNTAAAACLPERDFADNVLTAAAAGANTAVVTGWGDPKDGPVVGGALTLNHLSYDSLAQCVGRQPGLVTSRMGCTAPQANADCGVCGGSPLLTLHRGVFFLTGVVSPPPGGNCSQGYVYQRVSRYLDWLEPLMAIN